MNNPTPDPTPPAGGKLHQPTVVDGEKYDQLRRENAALKAQVERRDEAIKTLTDLDLKVRQERNALKAHVEQEREYRRVDGVHYFKASQENHATITDLRAQLDVFKENNANLIQTHDDLQRHCREVTTELAEERARLDWLLQYCKINNRTTIDTQLNAARAQEGRK